MPLYTLPPSSPPHVFLCLRAALWDASYLVALYLAIAVALNDRFWLSQKGLWHELVITIVGFVVAVLIEVEALRSGRWLYAPTMPLVRGLDVGISPVLQLAITALATFEIVRLITLRNIYGLSRTSPQHQPA